MVYNGSRVNNYLVYLSVLIAFTFKIVLRIIFCPSVTAAEGGEGLFNLGVSFLSGFKTTPTYVQWVRLDARDCYSVTRCSLGMYFPLEGTIGQEWEVAKNRREGSDLHWLHIYQKVVTVLVWLTEMLKKHRNTRVLSLGIIFFSMGLLCIDTVRGRQGEP